MAGKTKNYKQIAVDEINPYENNPRIITDEAIESVVESIRANGERDPIEIDENNIILSGHTRLEALKRLGIEKTNVIQYTDMDEAQKRAYRIAANKTAEKSAWDEEKLAIELEVLEKDLSDLDISIESLGDFTGFEGYELDEIQGTINCSSRAVEKQQGLDENKKHACPKCGYEY